MFFCCILAHKYIGKLLLSYNKVLILLQTNLVLHPGVKGADPRV